MDSVTMKFNLDNIMKQDRWLSGDFISDLTMEEVKETLWGIYENPDDYDICFEKATDLAAEIMGIDPLSIIGEMFFI